MFWDQIHSPIIEDIQKKFQAEKSFQQKGVLWPFGVALSLFLANETLLRTLLSYCSLHGATGGLASVRMELMLLLQELQQEKTHQQLLSPLPFPTSLPLLAASVASSKTVVADPIRYLQCLSHDMLQTVSKIRSVCCLVLVIVFVLLFAVGGKIISTYQSESVVGIERFSYRSFSMYLSIIV